MDKRVLRKAQYVGLSLVALHTALAAYSFYLFMVTYAGDGQAAMVLIPLALLDLPITALLIGSLQVLPDSLLPEWFLPFIYLVSGALFWFRFPRLFFPKACGGFWGRGKPTP